MSEKNLSLSIFLYMVCVVVMLSVAGCGDDSNHSTTSDVSLENLLNNPPPLENPKTNVGIDPSLAMGKDDLLRISYYDKTNGDLKFARCTDLSCSTPVITKIDTAGDVGLSSSLEIVSDGFARISYYDGKNGDLKFARCTDADCTSPVLTTVDAGGDTATSLKNVGMGSSLAIGPDGFALISYYDATNGNFKFAHCTDADCISPTLTVVSPSGIGGAHTSIDIGSGGFARISHWDPATRDLDYTLCKDVNCSITPTNTTLDPGGSLGLGSGSSLVIAPDGFARISYFGEKLINGEIKGVIKYVQCTNDACTTKNISEIGPAIFGAKTSIGIAPDGFARISYYDGQNGDLGSGGLPLNNGVPKFVRCASLSCTNPTVITLDDTPNDLTRDSNSGEFPSLVIGVDGLAKIAYFHRTNGDLKLAQCTDSDCKNVSIVTIDR